MTATEDEFRERMYTGRPFVARVALASGVLTRHELSEHFERALPGVYVLRGSEQKPEQRVRAAQLWIGDRGVVCGWSAALLHGERYFAQQRPVEVAVPRGLRIRRQPGVLVRYTPVPLGDTVLHDGFRIATADRAAVDVVRRLRGDHAVRALDSLLNGTAANPAGIVGCMAPRRGMHGRRRVLDALALADAGAQSPQETTLRLEVRRAGHTGFATQVPILDERGATILTADLADSGRRIALEYDGEHHLMREQRDWDSTVALRAARAGWAVIRVTSGMLDDPRLLLERLDELRTAA